MERLLIVSMSPAHRLTSVNNLARVLRMIRGWRLAIVTLVTSSCLHQVAAPVVPEGPPELHWETAAFDAGRGRLVTFGGMMRREGTFRYGGETLEWDGAQWLRAADSTSGPPVRHAHAMVFDPQLKRIVAYGGVFEPPQAAASPRCDTWSFQKGVWTKLADQCITQRPAPSLVYDARAKAVLLIEGPAGPPPDSALRPLRIWRLQDARWVLVDSTGPRRARPHQVAYDRARGVLVVPVFGGADQGVWERSTQGWTRMASDGPARRSAYAAAYDERLERVVMIGGLLWDRREWLDDAWTWDGKSWEPLAALGKPIPPARSNATLSFDPGRGRLLLFGGAGTGGRLLRELWIYDRSGWRRSGN